MSSLSLNTSIACDEYKQQPSFRVESFERSDYFAIKKMTDAWKKIAKEKRGQAEPKSFDFAKFDDSAFICEGIGFELRFWKSEEEPFCEKKGYVCKDEQGNIEGVLLLQIYEKSIFPFENAIEISHLATHPKNIRSSINERELNQVKGVGTHLLRFAERKVLERNKERLILKTLDSAAGYYAKEGFEPYPEHRILFKTADKIRQEISPLKQVA